MITQTKKFLIGAAVILALVILGQVQEYLQPGAAIFF